MATVKKKKKFIVPIVIVLVIALVVASVVVVKTKNNKTEVSLSSIATDSIIENVSATGDVTSGSVREYKVGTVATVKEVFVKVGDKVKEGDLLATFDTTDLDSQVSKLQSTYNEAKKSYDSAVKNQNEAKKNLKTVEKELEKAQAQLAALNTKPQTTTKKAKSTTKKATTTASSVKIDVTAKNAPGDVPVVLPEVGDYTTITDSISELVETLNQVSEQITNISDSVQATNQITQIVMGAIGEEIANGNLSSESIANAVGEAMKDAIDHGMIEFIDSGVAIDAVSAAVSNVDWAAIGEGFSQDRNVQITAAQLMVSSLIAQKEIYLAAADGTVVNAQKSVMESSKSALDAVKSAQSELAVGWKASFDGTITDCSITPGSQTNMISSGITLENTDKMVVTISLGEYDVHKVKVGMPASIKTAYGEYTGEVVSIAPTATGGGQSSIMDSVGSMAGISGLSSLTSAGAGVKCEISVDDPDENIIIGFEASVDIQTGKFDAVPCVPIESIILEKEGTYVYLYDEEEGTVTKTKIETGAISDTAYEVKSGLNIGDKIVSIPSADYEEETFEVKVK